MPVVLFLWGRGETKGNSLCLRACPCWPAAEGAVQVCLHLRSNLTHSRGEKLETVWMDRLRTTWSFARVLLDIHKGDQCPVLRYVYTEHTPNSKLAGRGQPLQTGTWLSSLSSPLAQSQNLRTRAFPKNSLAPSQPQHCSSCPPHWTWARSGFSSDSKLFVFSFYFNCLTPKALNKWPACTSTWLEANFLFDQWVIIRRKWRRQNWGWAEDE